MSTPVRHQFVALDGLRGIAAVLVLTYHASDTTAKHMLPGAYLAVDLFFVLSGFVIAHAYQARIEAGMSRRAFVAARLVRLYPLYLLATLVSLALVAARLALHQHPAVPSGATLITALAFAPSPDRVVPFDHLYPLNFPAWSLFFEVGIGVVYAVIARHLTDQRLAAVIGLGAVLLIATTTAYGSLNVGYTWPLAAGGAGRVVCTFFAGIAVERLWQRGMWPMVTVPPLAGGAVIIALFAITPGPWRAGYDAAVALVAMPLLILGSARREPWGWTARAFTTAGTASYAIYVLHVPVRDWLISASPHLTGKPFAAFGAAGTLASVAVTVVVALAADRIYDLPLRARLTGLLRRRQARRDKRQSVGVAILSTAVLPLVEPARVH